MTNQYLATTVKIQRPSGAIESFELSLGQGGSLIPTPETERLIDLLQTYADSALSTIQLIKEVQSFLVCSGYGLSNVILISASAAHIAKVETDQPVELEFDPAKNNGFEYQVQIATQHYNSTEQYPTLEQAKLIAQDTAAQADVLWTEVEQIECTGTITILAHYGAAK